MLNEYLARVHIPPLEPLPTGLAPRGGLAVPLQSVLFDIYGTLLISGSGDVGTSTQADAGDERLQRMLLDFGVDRAPASVLNDFHAAIEARHRKLRARGVDHPEVRIDRIWASVLGFEDITVCRRFALAFELLCNPVFPMPGLTRLMEKGRASLPMGIISNAQFYTPLLFRKFFDASLEDLGFSRDLTIFSFELECAKPSDYLFRVAKRRLNRRAIDPEKTLYVGNDMLNDILPAARAGFKTALFAGDRRSLRLRKDDARCRGLKPDMVITELEQLMDYL